MASSLPTPPAQNKPKLLDQVRERMRLRHYSIRTEEAYISWIRRYILFHGKRHPRELGESEVAKFLTSLATDHGVAASTQNQALNALLFLGLMAQLLYGSGLRLMECLRLRVKDVDLHYL
jgi:Site-specific recombinase XerD